MSGGLFGMSSRNTSHHKKKKAKYQKPIAEKADQVSANPPAGQSQQNS